MTESRTIEVGYLARVEGEGALHVVIENGAVQDVQLRIFEPPRFFEALLRGRQFAEAPDVTARICGICPVAYQMSAVHAMEDAFGVTVPAPLRALRRLLYCGEWIESHTLHVHMLHAPDFLGRHDIIELAREHPEAVERGLRLKQTGNRLVALLGGREIHPINVRVGGFHKIPPRERFLELIGPLEQALEDALAAAAWVAGFEFPDFELDYEFVGLQHPTEYPLNEGRLVSSRGLDITAGDWDQHFEEVHRQHTHALQSRRRSGGTYHVGPLARFHLNRDRLTPEAGRAATAAGLGASCRNPFRSIVVRAVETVFACEEALRILDTLELPDRPHVAIEPRAGTGHAATEAPRGTLLHSYRIDAAGAIEWARIVPPTSQNQASIEDDLRRFVSARLDWPHERLRHGCEQAIRNYDPCISCATHFLDLTLEHR